MNYAMVVTGMNYAVVVTTGVHGRHCEAKCWWCFKAMGDGEDDREGCVGKHLEEFRLESMWMKEECR
jgi:hypothetical protein